MQKGQRNKDRATEFCRWSIGSLINLSPRLSRALFSKMPWKEQFKNSWLSHSLQITWRPAQLTSWPMQYQSSKSSGTRWRSTPSKRLKWTDTGMYRIPLLYATREMQKTNFRQFRCTLSESWQINPTIKKPIQRSIVFPRLGMSRISAGTMVFIRREGADDIALTNTIPFQNTQRVCNVFPSPT